MIRPVLVLLALLIISPCIMAASEVCTAGEDAAAETRIDHIHGWISLHKAYASLRVCDSGGTSERINDIVIKLLATHWPKTPPNYALIANDPGFKDFIVLHINATGDLNDLKRVRQNAETLCLKGQEDICKPIADKAKQAIDELASAWIQ